MAPESLLPNCLIEGEAYGRKWEKIATEVEEFLNSFHPVGPKGIRVALRLTGATMTKWDEHYYRRVQIAIRRLL